MNVVTLKPEQASHTISRHIYGHFAEHLGRCIYGGIWVGEDSAIPNTRGIRNDVVEALKAIGIPNLRWPGGCFADEYHWMDGIGPRETRPSMINTHWGGVSENNHFGTHEFLDLCEQLGCEPYICGNVGSGTVQEMQQWVEYLTSDAISPMTELRRQNGRDAPWKVKFWGVGNENWGCGGSMHPAYYADLYRRYQTYVRNFGDNEIYKIACGANSDDYSWTEIVMKQVRNRTGNYLMHGLSLHYYTLGISGPPSLPATGFDENQWFDILSDALKMDALLNKHIEIMDEYDPDKTVGLILDEWGSWYQVEPGTNPGFLYQQNSLRDALLAAVTLDIFNKHGDRVKMANIAQTVNVLQAMILTEEGGERMVLTPTYHVFEMYKRHHGATWLPIEIECETYTCAGEGITAIHGSASRDESGKIHLTLSNLDPNSPHEVTCHLLGTEVQQLEGRILTASMIDAHNTFDAPTQVTPVSFTDARVDGERVSFSLPARAIVALTLM